MLTVFGLSFRAGDWNLYRLLLTGVVFSAGCGALISLMLLLAPQAAVKGMLFWLMGDLSGAAYPGWAWVVWRRSVLASVLWRARSTSQPRPQQSGLAGRRRWRAAEIVIYLAASAATVTSVPLAGTVGFVGLIVPHLVRLLGRNRSALADPGRAFSAAAPCCRCRYRRAHCGRRCNFRSVC